MLLHESISSFYDLQKKQFDRIVRLSFTAAGTYWLVIYALRALDILEVSQLAQLRAGQTWVYFLLLTAWGVESLREAKRYKAVVRVSNDECRLPNEVSMTDLGKESRSFAITRPLPSDSRSRVMPLVNILLLFLSVVLIAKQYAELVVASMK